VISFGIPDYMRATGGPELAFAAARRAVLADDEARRRDIVAAYASPQRSACHPACVPCAHGLPRNGQVYKIHGELYSHADGVGCQPAQ
jgi:hypothetical protein